MKGLNSQIRFRRISITLGSVIAGFNCSKNWSSTCLSSGNSTCVNIVIVQKFIVDNQLLNKRSWFIPLYHQRHWFAAVLTSEDNLKNGGTYFLMDSSKKGKKIREKLFGGFISQLMSEIIGQIRGLEGNLYENNLGNFSMCTYSFL